MGKGTRRRAMLGVLCLFALAMPFQSSAENVADRACTGAFVPPSTSCPFKVYGSRLIVGAAITLPAGATSITVSIKHTTEFGTTTLLDCSATGPTATGCAKVGFTTLAPLTNISCVVSGTPGGGRGAYWCSSSTP